MHSWALGRVSPQGLGVDDVVLDLSRRGIMHCVVRVRKYVPWSPYRYDDICFFFALPHSQAEDTPMRVSATALVIRTFCEEPDHP